MAFGIDDIINLIGANSAAKDQQAGIQSAMDQQQSTYNQNAANYQPYVQAGQRTLGNLANQVNSGAFLSTYQGANLDPSQIANDPGYQFRMEQGQQALQRSAAAKGGLNSGGFMKGLANYSQGLASTEYQNAWNRNFQNAQAQNQFNLTQGQNAYNQMYGLANMGLGATNSLAQLGSNYANNMSNLQVGMGNSKAARDVASTYYAGKAGSDAFSDILSLGTGGFGGGGGGLTSLLAGGGGQNAYGGYGIPTQQLRGSLADVGYGPSSMIPYQGGY